MLLDVLLRRVECDDLGRFVGLTLFGLTPISLAIFWSAQNDGIAMVAIMATAVLALRFGDRDSNGLTVPHAFFLGLAAGVCMLAKITLYPIFPALLIWLYWRFRRGKRLVRDAALLAAGAFVVVGWWFIRNIVLYGALSGDRTHAGLPASHGAGLPTLSLVIHLGREIVTYLWVPTEYYRNLIHLPLLVQIVLAVATLAPLAAVAWSWFARRRRPPRSSPGHSATTAPASSSTWVLVGSISAVALVGWVVIYLVAVTFPARIAMIAFPLWYLLAAKVVSTLRSRRQGRPIAIGAAGVVVLAVVGLNIWMLTAAAGHQHLSDVLMQR